MSNYNFEGHSEGDWDGRGELSMSEKDWQLFLARHDKEVQRFMDLYQQCRHLPNHLDEIALLMGWDAQDWSVTDSDEFDEDEDEDEEFQDIFASVQREAEAELADEGASSDSAQDPVTDDDPYTMQRHPVYVVVRGLYRIFDFYFDKYLKWGQPPQPTSQRIWALAKVTREGEHNAVLAVASLDIGDISLAVCQMKRSLAAYNETFRLLGFLQGHEARAAGLLFVNLQQILFDLREVSLRVMQDCRAEIRRQAGEDQEF